MLYIAAVAFGAVLFANLAAVFPGNHRGSHPHPTSPADRVATTGTQKRSPEHIASRPKDLESRNSATLISVFIGRNGSDRDAEHRARGGPRDSICSGHRAPPTVIANSAVRAMSIMYVRCVSALGHICTSLTCGYSFHGFGQVGNAAGHSHGGSSPSRTHAYVHADGHARGREAPQARDSNHRRPWPGLDLAGTRYPTRILGLRTRKRRS